MCSYKFPSTRRLSKERVNELILILANFLKLFTLLVVHSKSLFKAGFFCLFIRFVKKLTVHRHIHIKSTT